MNKQDILKKLEELIPDGEYTGDMILCLNDKDNYPNVYPSIRMNQIPQIIGKISTFLTAQYTMQFVAAEQQKAAAAVLANCKPEDKEGFEEMFNLMKKKDEY